MQVGRGGEERVNRKRVRVLARRRLPGGERGLFADEVVRQQKAARNREVRRRAAREEVVVVRGYVGEGRDGREADGVAARGAARAAVRRGLSVVERVVANVYRGVRAEDCEREARLRGVAARVAPARHRD